MLCRSQLKFFSDTLGPTLRHGGVRLIALVKEVEHAFDLDGFGDFDVFVDHSLDAFKCMGAGSYGLQFWRDLLCPTKCMMCRLLCGKPELQTNLSDKPLELLEQAHKKGDPYTLGGCWVIRRKNTGNRQALAAAALATDGETEDFSLVLHHRASVS